MRDLNLLKKLDNVLLITGAWASEGVGVILLVGMLDVI